MFRARTLVDKTFLATQIFVTAGGDLSGDEPAARIPDPPGGGAPVARPAMSRVR